MVRNKMGLGWKVDNGKLTRGNACSSRVKRLVCYSSQREERRAVEGGRSMNCNCELCSLEAKVDFTQSS